MGANSEVGRNILIIHENRRIARFFEGVLRNGFHPKAFTNVHEAAQSIAADPPNLIVCDSNCIAGEDNVFVEILENNFHAFQLPLILVTEYESEDNLQLLTVKVVDCVPRSVNPCLLKWKVKLWLDLSQEINRIRKSSIQAVERSCRLESQLQTFLHDMRSPVTAIRGLVSRLRRNSDVSCSEAQREATLEVLDNVSRSLEDFLLDSAKTIMQGLDAVEWEPVRLDEVAFEVIRGHQQLIEDSGIQVQTDTIVGQPIVVGNKQSIRQVLDNLVLNAIKHMRGTCDPCITITIAENGTYVVTSIRDNGMGIPDEHLAKVFDRFYRVPGSCETPGSGLGLSIVKQIVEEHNGVVWVDSRPGNGATFGFTLPRYYSA
jgi:signal transduction histidine kinase